MMHVHDLVEQAALDGHLPLAAAQGGQRWLASHILELTGQRRVEGDGEQKDADPSGSQLPAVVGVI